MDCLLRKRDCASTPVTIPSNRSWIETRFKSQPSPFARIDYSSATAATLVASAGIDEDQVHARLRRAYTLRSCG